MSVARVTAGNATKASEINKITTIAEVKTADYTITDTDYNKFFSVTGGRTITLPTLADNLYHCYTIMKSDDNAWYVDVDGEGAETINGEEHYYLRRQYDYITIMGMATEWRIIANGAPKIIDTGWVNTTDWSNRHLGIAVALTSAASFDVGNKIVGTTSGNYGWIIGKSGNTVYLRDHTETSGTGFANGETITEYNVDGSTGTTTTTTAASRNVDANIYHGFNKSIWQLRCTAFYSPDKTEALATILAPVTLTTDPYGAAFFGVDANAVKLQMASSGTFVIGDGGTRDVLAANDDFFRAVISEL